MKLKHVFRAVATAAVMALASQATATTINFTSSGTGAGGLVDGGPLSYTTSGTLTATVPFFGTFTTPSPVNAGVNGLGVGFVLAADQINNSPLSTETLTVNFSWAVNLVSFTLGLLSDSDDFRVAFNGGPFTAIGPAVSNPFAGQNNVTSFSIQAFASLDFDAFTLASATIAPVPLPAGGVLLLAGLGGLVVLRRRKTA